MKVYVKNKIMSIGGGSEVLNENKECVFKVKGRPLSITRVKYVCDNKGNRLFKVRNKWMNWFVHKAYVYDAQKNKIATVKDKWFNYNNEFFITGYKDEIRIEGKIFSPECRIIENGEVTGTIRRQLTFIADAFELEADEEHIPFLIAILIAIDNITDKKRS